MVRRLLINHNIIFIRYTIFSYFYVIHIFLYNWCQYYILYRSLPFFVIAIEMQLLTKLLISRYISMKKNPIPLKYILKCRISFVKCLYRKTVCINNNSLYILTVSHIPIFSKFVYRTIYEYLLTSNWCKLKLIKKIDMPDKINCTFTNKELKNCSQFRVL